MDLANLSGGSSLTSFEAIKMEKVMLTSALCIFVLILCSTPTRAQTLPNPSRCVADSGVTAFPACSYMYGQFSICSSYAAVSDAYNFYNCYCEQKYFNAIYE